MFSFKFRVVILPFEFCLFTFCLMLGIFVYGQYGLDQGDHVLNLAAIKEAGAKNVVGYADIKHGFLNRSRLEVCPIEHGDLIGG